MKKISAVIRPFKLDELKERLEEIGIRGIVVTEVKYSDFVEGGDPSLKELGIASDFLPRLFVETVVHDDMVDEVVDAFLECAGQEAGSETLLVMDVLDAVRIRTGERGEEAI